MDLGLKPLSPFPPVSWQVLWEWGASQILGGPLQRTEQCLPHQAAGKEPTSLAWDTSLLSFLYTTWGCTFLMDFLL